MNTQLLSSHSSDSDVGKAKHLTTDFVLRNYKSSLEYKIRIYKKLNNARVKLY